MERFIIHSNGKILLISNYECFAEEDEKLFKIDLPSDITDEDLMDNFIVKNEKLLNKNEKIPFAELKIAFVSNYNSQCGISTYSEKLYKHIIPHILDYRIFSEYSDTEGFSDTDKILYCWKRGESIELLIDNINKFKPDIVLIQHEYGIWPNARIWLNLLTRLDEYKTYVVLHSVYANHDDKTVCESAIKNIIVHTEIAHKCLKNKKLNGNIIKIPHGCDDLHSLPKPWNMYKSEHTFVQFGFGFRYKGWENSLKMVANLKSEYNDIFFTGVFGESPFNIDMHQSYYEELMKLVNELGIQSNVGFIRGFLDNEILMKILKMNKVAVFPYIDNGVHTVCGCSGAARTAMTANIPVIVSNVPLFDDLTNICPRCENVDQLCNNIKTLWKDKKSYSKQILLQNKFLKDNHWNNVSKLFLDEFSKLS